MNTKSFIYLFLLLLIQIFSTTFVTSNLFQDNIDRANEELNDGYNYNDINNDW